MNFISNICQINANSIRNKAWIFYRHQRKYISFITNLFILKQDSQEILIWVFNIFYNLNVSSHKRRTYWFVNHQFSAYILLFTFTHNKLPLILRKSSKEYPLRLDKFIKIFKYYLRRYRNLTRFIKNVSIYPYKEIWIEFIVF